MSEEQIQNLDEAIEQHLERHGARNWKMVKERFPDISNATFWRHVKVLRQAPVIPDPKPAEQVLSQMGGHGLFPKFFEPLKKLAEYERLLAEVEEMGRQAKNNQGKIVNWRMYVKSMEMRRTLLEQQIAAARMLVDLGKLELQWDAVIETVAAASPEVKKDIVERVSALNERLYAPA
jgi:hypothetical protein